MSNCTNPKCKNPDCDCGENCTCDENHQCGEKSSESQNNESHCGCCCSQDK